MEEKEQIQHVGDNQNSGSGSQPKTLQSFITDQYERQRAECQDSSNIDEDRSAAFFARALGESQRMNAEVDKANRKLDKLHEEFGAGSMASWRNEHAAEVLHPHEIKAINAVSHDH